MDKGIRPAVLNQFATLNELRRRGIEPYVGKKADTRFRKDVMAFLMDEFGCTLAAAATHYNYALHEIRNACPELVAGLGRPEDKNNGGRKPKAKAAVQATPAEVPGSVILSQGIKPYTSVHTISINPIH